MENSKNIVVFLLFFANLCFSQFQQKSAIPIQNSSDVQQVDRNAHKKVHVKNGIYRDTLNRLYLKVKNRPLRHPSQFGKHLDDSNFLSKVYFDTGMISLNSILDLKTFRKINGFGTYWVDISYVYVYKVIPAKPQFFEFKRGKERFFGTKRDFLLYDGTLYFYGDIVDGIDTKKYP